ncbi:MAG TPA: hypothetical protein VHG69_07265 [Thermoleophilaceae bacterium]|nr:hypothetical protein [Thermoleophilaceae bacterium]
MASSSGGDQYGEAPEVTGAEARRLRGPLTELPATGGLGHESTLERD